MPGPLRKEYVTQVATISGLVFLMTFNQIATAQNVESIGRDKPLSVSGGVNANCVFYHASGVETRRDPFNYFFSGNLSLAIYGWSIPFSFAYSNQQSSFQQPFNQYGLSPAYKWITFHGGYRSMTFSNYTMNGHMFLGVAFDLAPADKLKVSAFYGRLQKETEEDTTNVNNVPAYRRMGGGMKMTIGDSRNSIGVIIFKAEDDLNSLDAAPIKSDVAPEENLVLGFNFVTTLNERLVFNGEYASSAITNDVRNDEIGSHTTYDHIHFAFRPRTSSSFYNAMKSAMTYSFSSATVGVAYERIDPGYRTLGAYYFNNNIESIALTGSSIFLKKRLRINGQTGIQRNNLDNNELNTMNRFSCAINVNFKASKKLTVNSSYSNFQTVINFRSQFDYLNRVSAYENLDTLNYRQVTQNASANLNYVINENQDRRQNANVNIGFQRTSDMQADVEQASGSRFYNLNGSYTMALPPRNVTLNIAANANFTRSPTMNNRICGPSASIRRVFFKKKLSTSGTLSYNNSYVNRRRTGEVTNIRLNAAYIWLENHQFDLSLTQSKRFARQNETERKFRELTIQLGYNYNFN